MKIFTLISLLLLIACNKESTTEKENTKSTAPTVEKPLDAEIKKIDPLKKDLEKIKAKIEAKKIVDKTDEIEAPVHEKESVIESTSETSIFAGQKIEVEEITENPNSKNEKKKDTKAQELILED